MTNELLFPNAALPANMPTEPPGGLPPNTPLLKTGLLDQLGISRPNFSAEQNALRAGLEKQKAEWKAGGFVQQDGPDGRSWHPAPPTYTGGRP